MQFILTPKGSRAIDRSCIEELQMTGLDLMTTAASNAVEVLTPRLSPGASILIACGSGNNGGDGFAMAHMLSDQYSVSVVTDAEERQMSSETLHHYKLASSSASIISWADLKDEREVDVVVDAIMGTGGSSKLRDPIPQRLTRLNTFNAFNVAIDVPTGVDALTGEVNDHAFQAALTITMEGIKAGCLSAKGRDASGETVVVSIGAPQSLVASYSKAAALEDRDVRSWLPVRDRRSSKFDFGRVLVIAGSRRMRGAAALTSEAVMRVGTGLCVLATTEVHPLVPREVMTEVLDATPSGAIASTARKALEQQLMQATAAVIGPGIGTEEETLNMLADVINDLDPALPLVIDADGLRLLPKLNRDLSHVVLTPHEGEYHHLVRGREHLDPHCLPKDLAIDLGCVVHKKGVPSVTSDGRTDVWTLRGNPGMSTAGSGDVLSGIIGGLLAQGLSPLRASSLGAFIHARAGDIAAEDLSQEYMTAGDIITRLPRVLNV